MKIIVATNSDWAIDFPTPRIDKRRFAWLTFGAPVVMGRRTWDSLPEKLRPLPHRDNFVVTNKEFPQVWETTAPPRFGTWAQYLREWTNYGSPLDVWAIGGGQLYHQALPHAKMLYLSYFPNKKGGSVKFPESLEHFINTPTWQILSQDDIECGGEDDHTFFVLKRR